ncbi:MAG TPA: hypothetical protein VFB45_13970 [Pseudolabrys sp.]|nr:hypothetical protein [Pseudolabrys sp.]
MLPDEPLPVVLLPLDEPIVEVLPLSDDLLVLLSLLELPWIFVLSVSLVVVLLEPGRELPKIVVLDEPGDRVVSLKVPPPNPEPVVALPLLLLDVATLPDLLLPT